MAELTEMRITANNAASPKILPIQGPRREGQWSQQSTGPRTTPGPTASHSGPLGTSGIPGVCAPRPPRRGGLGFRTPHVCRLDGGSFGSVSLAGVEAASSPGLVWLPLLPGKGSSQLPTQLPLFPTSPFLMWQLSAHHCARCQGNHGGVAWAQDAAARSLRARGAGRPRAPRGPWGLEAGPSSPELLPRAAHSSFLLRGNGNQLLWPDLPGPGGGKGGPNPH